MKIVSKFGSWMLVAAMASIVSGCFDGTGSSVGALRQGASCNTAGQCAAGLECEIEHGVATCQPHRDGTATTGSVTTGQACSTFEQCAAGLECEIEHGQGFCQPHGGGSDDNSDGSSSDASSDADDHGGRSGDDDARTEDDGRHGDDTTDDRASRQEDAVPRMELADARADTMNALPCSSDADCPQGSACEIENGAGSCRPHAADLVQMVDGKRAGAVCFRTADCAIGLECKLDGEGGICRELGTIAA